MTNGPEFLSEIQQLRKQIAELEADCQQKHKSEEALQLMVHVAAHASGSKDMSDLVVRCLEAVCQLHNWDFGEAWLVGQDQEMSLWQDYLCQDRQDQQDPNFQEFCESGKKLRYKMGLGLPGRIWETGKPIWIETLAADKGFLRAASAKKCGLVSGFGFPIKSDQDVLAVFVFFSREPRKVNPRLINAADQLGQNLSLVFQKLKNEETGQKQEQLIQAILDNLSEGVVACDAAGVLTIFNHAASNILGMPIVPLPPEKWSEHYNVYYADGQRLMGKEDLPLYRALQGESVCNAEVTIKHPSRASLHLLVNGGPIIAKDGTNRGALVTFHDITARKVQEEDLRLAHAEMESKVLSRTAELTEANIHFSISRDLFCIADFAGDFKRLNPAWERALGYSLEELYSTPIIEFIHPDDRETTITEGMKLTEGKDLISFEIRFACKDGTYKWLLWSATALPEKQIVYAVAHDITERKRQEEKIQLLNQDLEEQVYQLAKANQALESLTDKLSLARDQALEASKLKSEFVANISHEIRTPLSGVIGMTELVLDTALTAEQKVIAQSVRDSAQSLLVIINDILDFSKIEAGKIALVNKAFDLHQLITSTKELLNAAAKQKQLTLNATIKPDVPTALIGDPVRIRQVLLNLVSNAIKFTEQGSIEILVEVEQATEGHEKIRFAVKDTGIGVSELAKQRLFEPFMQADGSTTREYGGTGLGLSISKRLVQLLGGTIGMQSQPGVGSTFWFVVPLVRSRKTNELEPIDNDLALFSPLSAPTLKAPMYSASNAGYAPILLVEDSPILQELAVRQLNKLGLNVHCVANGKEAIEAYSQNDYRLILMDVQMPVMDGYQATAAIRRLEGTADKRIPIVAMTAGAMHGDEAKCLVAGMDGYLSKPVSMDSLKQTINQFSILPGAEILLDGRPGNNEGSLRAEQGKPEQSLSVTVSRLTDLYGTKGTSEILQSFRTEAKQLLAELHQAIQEGEGQTCARLAHQFKGLSSVLADEALVETSQRLEQSAHSHNWTSARQELKNLEESFKRLADGISKLDIVD